MRKKVCFNEIITIYSVSGSKSERKSLWMQHAVDRFRFHREIQRLNPMLSKAILHKLERIGSVNIFENPSYKNEANT